MISRHTFSGLLLAAILCFATRAASASPATTTKPASQPAKSGLSREKAIAYISACERLWYNQAYFYRIRGAKYQSVESIDKTSLFMHGFKLLVLTNERQVEEALIDSRDNPTGKWRRAREISAFDGTRRTDWIDYENEAVNVEGGRHAMMQNPAELYAFYGYALDRPLSLLIKDAQEFYFSPQIETINGDRCAIANCVYRASENNKAATQKTSSQTVRYEIALAVEGGLFPKRIQRFVDRGDGEKRAAVWEVMKVDKDAQRRVWQMKEGRFFNLGTQSIYVLEILNRRFLTPEQSTAKAFGLALPSDAIGATTQPAAAPVKKDAKKKDSRRSKTTHPQTTFLTTFMGVTVADLEKRLNQSYKDNFVPEWGREMQLPVKKKK